MDPMQRQKFDQLEQSLEMFVENVRHFCVMAGDFPSAPSGQQILNQKIHTMVSGLQQLDQMKQNFTNVKIPLELIDCVDEAKNPQIYTKGSILQTREKNEKIYGKVEIYEKFRANLLKELHENLPEVANYYRLVRENSGNSRES